MRWDGMDVFRLSMEKLSNEPSFLWKKYLALPVKMDSNH